MLNNLKAAFIRFMQGRYGNDGLNDFLQRGALILIVIQLVCDLLLANVFSGITLLSRFLDLFVLPMLIVWALRFFSKKHDKRRREAQRFYELVRKFDKKRKRLEASKDFKYLKCQACGQDLRVPRGKGNIAVRCPKCGEKTKVKS